MTFSNIALEELYFDKDNFSCSVQPPMQTLKKCGSLKMNGYTSRGSNSTFSLFCLPSLLGSTLKGKSLLLSEQTLSFKSSLPF